MEACEAFTLAVKAFQDASREDQAGISRVCLGADTIRMKEPIHAASFHTYGWPAHIQKIIPQTPKP